MKSPRLSEAPPEGERVSGGTIFRTSKRHWCAPPLPTNYDVGDTFRCDCGKAWKLGEDYYDNKIWRCAQ